jgi:EamA domain-containing membrane protein RarD
VFVALGLIHCLGDYFLKRASISFSWLHVLLAMGLWISTTPGYLWLMKIAKLATLASIGAAVNIITMVAMGIFLFHEHLTTREVIGVVLAIAAIAMFYK